MLMNYENETKSRELLHAGKREQQKYSNAWKNGNPIMLKNCGEEKQRWNRSCQTDFVEYQDQDKNEAGGS